jgi:hypothetical protein
LITKVHDGFAKPAFGSLDIIGNLWQVMKLERRAVFVDQTHEVNTMKKEAVFSEKEFVLREIKSLFDQVNVFGSHACWLFKKRLYAKLPTGFRFCASILCKNTAF